MKAVIFATLSGLASCVYAVEKPINVGLGDYRLLPTLSEKAVAQNKLYEIMPELKPEPKQAKEEKYNYSLGIGGLSRHNTHGEPNNFKEQNPHLEFNYWLDYSIFGGRPFIGIAHTFANSRRGTSDMIVAAIQWKLVPGPYLDLCGGLGGVRMKYRDGNPKPGKPSSITETVPVAYLCLEKGPVSARFVPLGKDILFMYFVYSWK